MASGAGGGAGAGAGAGSTVTPALPMATPALSTMTPTLSGANVIGTAEGYLSKKALTVLVVGASGDLAKKKTYPSLFELFNYGLVPEKVNIVGYARSKKTNEEFRAHLRKFLSVKGSSSEVEAFLARCVYHSGQYNGEEDMAACAKLMTELEAVSNGAPGGPVNRVFYYAIPPSVFATVSVIIKAAGQTSTGWNRVVVEKPFGTDLASSKVLSAELAKSFDEDQLYRIDHYLGKEMVQNLMALRFANTVFEPLWNRHHISTVQIVFKEPFGTEGRGGYFDNIGIIRDVMQNHLTQVLALVAMEPPVSMSAESVRDEKVKVLKCIPPAKVAETVLGQYGKDLDNTKPGYHDDETVPKDSVCPTFATTVLRVNNPRWAGVPFILKCGKALNDRKAEIRIQFREKPNTLFNRVTTVHNNELVIRIQPKEAVYLKVMCKMPGLSSDIVETELDLSYHNRYPTRKPPEAYARLVLDVLRGDKTHFVRIDELNEAWRVFTPLLHQIESSRVQPSIYPYGSRGPIESDELIHRTGYQYGPGYSRLWSDSFGAPTSRTALDQLADMFALPRAALRGLMNSFIDEMRRGLCGEESSIKMIPSYVTSLPTGSETGDVWAMDLGGTNVRVVRYPLLGDGAIGKPVEFGAVVPEEVKKGTATVLFDWLADQIIAAGVPADATFGFTFSFPVEQTAINAGSLVHWTKGFTAKGVPGQDVVKLLNDALAAKGHNLTVDALVNDTVGTLVARRYEDKKARLGIILGTGTNAAYIEQAGHITKMKRTDRKGIMVINTEWGGFGSGSGGRRILPMTVIDQTVDTQSPHPAQQRFEKMISGEYMGEMVRLALLRLADADAVWTGTAAPGAASPLHRIGGFDSAYMAAIAKDDSDDLAGVGKVLAEHFLVASSTLRDRRTVQRVCAIVAKRAARLAAMAIAAVGAQMDSDVARPTAAVDGSVFAKYPRFKEWMQEALTELGCHACPVLTQDGSGIGAALIAVAARNAAKAAHK